jgi:voltage-gated potassium channel
MKGKPQHQTTRVPSWAELVPAALRLARQLSVATALLGACGVVYWLIEPRTPTLADGLWLAFTTAGTVGYGDVVPTTPAAKLFSVFVVLIGFAVLSLVTASIAAIWVESSERRMEREILHDLHQRIRELGNEITALRRDLSQEPGSVRLERQQPVEDQ